MSDPNEWNKKIIAEFRANDGKVGGPFEGSTILLLHTTGAKSGKARINPLVTMADGDSYFVIASKGGATSNPDWFHNLKANPGVEVEVGTEKFSATAVITDEPKRTELYERMAAGFAAFNEYKKTANRVIPVILLERQ